MDMQPTEIRLSADKTLLTLVYGVQHFALSAEYLRVESPSAEVQGHTGHEAKLVSGKQGLTIKNITPVGSYAVQITFADGHASGFYTWAYLHTLATEQPKRWQAYENDLTAHGLSRTVVSAPVLRHK